MNAPKNVRQRCGWDVQQARACPNRIKFSNRIKLVKSLNQDRTRDPGLGLFCNRRRAVHRQHVKPKAQHFLTVAPTATAKIKYPRRWVAD